jgi:catechol 2,3-dioxygenase-like lactoylglutathione lyase family enzyme
MAAVAPISHIHIGVNDLDRALHFYSAVLETLGWRLTFVDRRRQWAGWRPAGAERPLILVGRPHDGRAADPGNGHMLALQAETRDLVDRFHAAALAAGGRCDGAPGPRPEYHETYYGAYVRDPEGAKLCACCHL